MKHNYAALIMFMVASACCAQEAAQAGRPKLQLINQAQTNPRSLKGKPFFVDGQQGTIKKVGVCSETQASAGDNLCQKTCRVDMEVVRGNLIQTANIVRLTHRTFPNAPVAEEECVLATRHSCTFLGMATLTASVVFVAWLAQVSQLQIA